MKERPIMFKPEMVRAILSGAKTQTRRPIKRGQVFRFCRDGEGPCDLDAAERRAINAEPFYWERGNAAHPSIDQLLTLCPYGVPRDRLWVREARRRSVDPCGEALSGFEYRSEMSLLPRVVIVAQKSSAIIPRLTLEIVSVRVERVQEINAADAIAEGCGIQLEDDHKQLERSALGHFERGWDSLYAKTPYAWAANPFVWVVEFKRIEAKDGGAEG